MLLGDSSDIQHGATAFSCVMAVVTAVIGYMTGRDRLKFDAERVKLLATVDSHAKEIAECKDDRTQLRQMVDKLQNRMERHGIDCTEHKEDKPPEK